MPSLRIPKLPAGLLLRRAALAYLITWVLSPLLAYDTFWRVLAVMAMGVWLALELRSARSVILRPSVPVLCALAYFAYTLITELVVPDAGQISRHFQPWIMLFFLMVGESFRRGREGDARFCFWVTLALLGVWSATTLRGLETIDAHVARTVVRSSAEAMELSEQGVGGFSLVYTALLCLPALLYLSLHPRSFLKPNWGRWRRRLAWTAVAGSGGLSGLLILQAGYAIALILMAIVLSVVVLVRSRRRLPFAISLCFAGLLAAAGTLMVQPALQSLQPLAAGTKYEAKLRDIRTSLQSDQSVGTVEGRMERYTRSLRLFVKNPALGTLTIDDVGKHSAILDRFAQYGALIGAMFLYLLGFVPWRMLRDPGVPIGLAVATLVAALGFPLLNNVFMSWGVALYLFPRGACVLMGLPLDRNQKHPRPLQRREAVHA